MDSKHKLLLKASFAGTFAETMLLPMWAILTHKVGGNLMDAGIGYGVFSIVTGIIVMTIGSTEWFNANIKYMVFWGFTIAGTADLLYILVSTKYELFAVQCLCGIAVGFLNPAWDVMFTDTEEENDGAKWSFWNGGISFITGLAALAGAGIVTLFGFQWLFVGMAAFDLLAIYFAWKVMKWT